MANSKSVWDTLSAVDVSGHTEKKGKFTYLSWTWAWGLVKGLYPTATFEKKTFRDNQNNILHINECIIIYVSSNDIHALYIC